jgi:hypothetical protein
MPLNTKRQSRFREQVANWFLRLNGCFTIPNFVVHPDVRGGARTDADVLAVRFPHRLELARSPRPLRDHEFFASAQKVDLVIAEVKRGECALNGPWTHPPSANMHRVLDALGIVPRASVDDVARRLYCEKRYEDEWILVRLLALGERRSLTLHRAVAQVTWRELLAFVHGRFQAHERQKADHDHWDCAGRLLWRAYKPRGARCARVEESFAEDVLSRMGVPRAL